MRKRVVFGSFVAAFLLCIGVSATLAFAVTPEHAMNDLFDNAQDVEPMDPFESTPIEHIDGVADEDMTDAYEKIRGIVKLIDASPDVDVELDNLKAVQEINELSDVDSYQKSNSVQSASSDDSQNSPQSDHYITNALVINGVEIPYVASYQTETAPKSTAGLWLGSDDVNDGTWGYFIGHNPGVFTPILSLSDGSAVMVKDSSGFAHTYYVVKQFDVDKGTTWRQVENDVTGYGESIILQTCINGGEQYHIIVAA